VLEGWLFLKADCESYLSCCPALLRSDATYCGFPTFAFTHQLPGSQSNRLRQQLLRTSSPRRSIYDETLYSVPLMYNFHSCGPRMLQNWRPVNAGSLCCRLQESWVGRLSAREEIRLSNGAQNKPWNKLAERSSQARYAARLRRRFKALRVASTDCV
jgi:hypothetical protein